MSPEKLGLLVDFDGNMFRTLQEWVEATRETLQELALSGRTFTRPLPKTDYEIASQLVFELSHIKDFGLNVTEATAFINTVVERARAKHLDAIPHDGMIEALDSLASRGSKLAVVSSTEVGVIEGHLRRHGIDPKMFGIIVGRDTAGVMRRKPNPDPLLHAMTALTLDPRRTYMMGDHRVDIDAAKRAGTKSILFKPEEHDPYYGSIAEHLGEFHATHIIYSWYELLGALGVNI